METEVVTPGSLVLYKQRPGIVAATDGKKLTVRLEDGASASVRPKDVIQLHPGPLHSFSELRPPAGEILLAWELLAGQRCTLQELAELAYGDFSPAGAWAAWQQVADGLRFSGEPEAITARTPAEVAAEEAVRQAKADAEARWQAFLQRARAGRSDREQDGEYLHEVEELALGRRKGSRVMQALGREESPEEAHALLLHAGYWDETANPYPARMQLSLEPSRAPLPPLPGEVRLDLTHLPAYAIDDAGSRDPDDALSYQDGLLYVHVADVAALVSPDSPADQEAQARGSNLYLPEGVVNMLPPAATERLALGLEEISPALTFIIKPGEDATAQSLQITPSLVRVTRLSYDEVEGRLEESPFAELLALARCFEGRRLANGAIDINLPEVKVAVRDGRVTVLPLPNLQSRMLVREMMLLAGEATALFAQEQQIPIAYSTQEPPDADMTAFDGTPAGMFARLRHVRRSQPRSAPTPHAGLGMSYYTQCTSPLRRYLDLVAHQQLRAFLRGGQGLLNEAELMARVGAADAVAGAARWAERRSIDHWKLVYLLQNPGWQGDGVVVDHRGSRHVLLLPELALETELYLRREKPLNAVLGLQLEGVDLARLEARFGQV